MLARMERVAFVITDIGQMMASLQTQVEALVAFQLTDRTRVEMLHPPGGGEEIWLRERSKADDKNSK